MLLRLVSIAIVVIQRSLVEWRLNRDCHIRGWRYSLAKQTMMISFRREGLHLQIPKLQARWTIIYCSTSLGWNTSPSERARVWLSPLNRTLINHDLSILDDYLGQTGLSTSLPGCPFMSRNALLKHHLPLDCVESALALPYLVTHLVVLLHNPMQLLILLVHPLIDQSHLVRLLLRPTIDLFVEGYDVQGKFFAHRTDVLNHVLS